MSVYLSVCFSPLSIKINEKTYPCLRIEKKRVYLENCSGVKWKDAKNSKTQTPNSSGSRFTALSQLMGHAEDSFLAIQ